MAKVCIQTDFHSKFKTLSKIGEGNFASVYKVRDHTSKKEFAVKQFDREDLASHDTASKCLINEIEILRVLDHPNVVKLYEVHETRNSLYLVMEY